MILTVTPNPSLDLLYDADGLSWDDANRIPEPRRRPGGQGINAARAVRALGGDTLALALLGGATGDEITAALDREGTPLTAVRAADPTRLFIGIRDRRHDRSLLLNSPGPVRSAQDAELLLERVERTLHESRPAWVACCGSLPPGFDERFYATVGRLSRDTGSRFVPDCDGGPLERAAGHADLLVPNQHEAERLSGRPAGDPSSAAAAAGALRRAFDCPLVAITLGSAGAVLHDGRSAWHATPPTVAGSAVGAGDAFLAALVLSLEAGLSPAVALSRAAACGAAAVAATGAAILDVDRLDVMERETRLQELPAGRT
jgi:1-phosphofructokinase family hexose kinase